MTKGKQRVHASQYVYTEDGGEFEKKEWAAIAILEGAAKDAVAEAHVIGSEGEFATFGSIAEKGTSIVLIDEHADGTCLGPGTIGVFEERITCPHQKPLDPDRAQAQEAEGPRVPRRRELRRRTA